MPASEKDARYAALRRITRRRSQRGHFTAAQAYSVGISRQRLNRWLQQGVVVRVASRVYRFTVGSAPTWQERLAAELLATGGVACGLSATALYGLTASPLEPAVLVTRGSRDVRPGRHTTRELAARECATVDGLRALTPVRAILDSVHRVPRHQAVAMIESAIVKGLVKPLALERRARELSNPKRPGCAVALSILRDLHPELARSRNEWEALVARRAKAFGLPAPNLEYEVFLDGRRYIADAAWPAQKVLLEFDGRDPHMRRVVHDNDSQRRNDFNDAGWLRFGITAAALKRHDDRAFRQVANAIARRSPPVELPLSRIRDKGSTTEGTGKG
jgi:hypothetical protein